MGHFFNYQCGNKALLWGSFWPRKKVHNQASRAHIEGHGASPKGGLFSYLQAPYDLSPNSRSILPQGDLGSLQHEFKARNVHRKASNVGILMCDSTIETLLVQDVEWIQYAQGGKEIPKAKILWPTIWQVAPQGHFLAPNMISSFLLFAFL